MLSKELRRWLGLFTVILTLTANCGTEEVIPEIVVEDKESLEDYPSDERLSVPLDTGIEVSTKIRTEHYYQNNAQESFVVNQPGAYSISLHFAKFETERNYDFVYIYDSNNTLKKVYHGKLGDFWTDPVRGDSVTVKLVSDSSIRRYGFYIEKYSYTTHVSGDAVSWNTVAESVESLHNYEDSSFTTWTIEEPGADLIKLHFSRVDTEGGYDLIKLYDKDGNRIQTLSGYQLDFWSEPIPGDEVTIEFQTDGSVNDWGFAIDQYAWGIESTGPTITGTSEYPIILHHGFMGFDNILFVDYFYKVQSRLEDAGFVVYTTEVAPTASIAFRAGQLRSQVDTILDETGSEKVNIIAHSMGGLDARYLVSTLGYEDEIASLSTIATPHRGTAVADVAIGALSGPLGKVVDFFLGLFTSAYNQHQSPSEAEVMVSIENLTSDFVVGTFNPQNPDSPDVYYQSWTGKSSITGIGTGDFMDPFFYLSYGIIKSREGSNDGMVSVNSAKWGVFRGTIPADHMDEVGQLFGTTSWNFDHLDFYENICHELVEMGY